MSNAEKLIRVSEYARKEGISVVAAHKRINKNGSKLVTKKVHDLILIKVN